MPTPPAIACETSETARTIVVPPVPVAIVAGIAALALYARVLQPDFGFVNLDDPQYILNNRVVREPSLSKVKLVLSEVCRPSTVEGYYQPLTMISLMADAWLCRQFPGLRPEAVFHVTSVLWHVVNTLLVFAILHRISAAPVVAGVLAMLFALHPIQVESVAWISQRKTVLATAFALLGILACLQLRHNHRRWIWLAASGLCYVLAVLAKPTVVLLPAAFLLLDYWPLRRFSRGAAIEKIPLFVLMCAAALLTIVSQKESAGLGVPAWGDALAGARFMLHNVAFLLQRLAWPVDLSPYNPVMSQAALPALRTAVDGIVVSALIIIAIRTMRRVPAVFVGIMGYLILVGPALGHLHFTEGFAQDRFDYLPMVFLLIPLAVWLSRPQVERRGATVIAAAGLALGLISFSQMLIWRSGFDLYTHVLRLYPNHVISKVALADWLVTTGRPQEAIPFLQQAVQSEPDSASHRFYLGNALRAVGQADEALSEYEQAVRLEPQQPSYHAALAATLALANRSEEAVTHYEFAKERLPASLEVRMGLGFAYLALDRPASARAELQIAHDLRPNDARVHLGLACAWAKMGVLPTSRAHLAAAVAIDPRFAELAGREPALRELAQRAEFADLIRLPPADVTPPASRTAHERGPA